MKIQSINISTKVFLPIIAVLALLALTFGLLVSNFGREEGGVLTNITSTQQTISLIRNLSDSQNQVEQVVMEFRFKRDPQSLDYFKQSDTHFYLTIDNINRYLSNPQGRELLKLVRSSKQEATASRDKFVWSVNNSSKDMEQAYGIWRAKVQILDDNLNNLSSFIISSLDQDIAAFQKVVTEVIVTYLSILAATIILVLLLYAYIKYLIIRPINKLTEGAKLVTEGNLDWNVVVNSLDEIGKLNQTFKEMTQKLLNSQANLQALAFHDPLTGLPNRQALEHRLSQQTERAKKSQSLVGVMLLDLDRFKKINDTLGHDIGDLVLKEVSERLLSELRPNDAVIRLGGDEFVILGQLAAPADAGLVASRILKALEKDLVLNGQRLHLSGSLGVAIYPADGENLSTLLKASDIALYGAKTSGRNRYNFYNKVTDLHPTAELELEDDLRRALTNNQLNDQLKVFYQPIIDINSGKAVAAEALLRWQHPSLGLLLPHEFVPLAEEIGIIHTLGKWVLKTSCEEIKKWNNIVPVPLQIDINLSPRQFLEKDLAEDVIESLGKYNLPSNQVVLEITENLAMTDLEHSKEKIRKLSEAGISISIDDFGIGYSSLSSLKDLMAKKIKIDRSFIRHIITNPQDTAIVKAIITMGHNLDLIVAAEGVESDTQLALLKSLGCDEAQGYYLGKPMSSVDFRKWLLGSFPPAKVPDQATPDLAAANILESQTGSEKQELGPGVNTGEIKIETEIKP